MIRTRATLSIVMVAALAMLVVAPATADDLVSRQQKARQEREEVNKKLNLARASDVQIEAEANRLSKAVAAQTSKVESAQQAQWAAEAELAAERGPIRGGGSKGQAGTECAQVPRRLRVSASRPEPVSGHRQVVDADGGQPALGAAGLRAGLREDNARALPRRTRADLRAARDAQEKAKDRARERASSEAAARDKLVAAERAKEAAHKELSKRVATLQAESAALAATEANIQTILATRAPANAALLAQRNRWAKTPLNVTPSAGGFIWPAHGPVTSEYGPRWDMYHTGIDIGVFTGTPIVAAKKES